MKLEEKTAMVEGLKKNYKDFEEYIDNHGKDRIKFNLGEIAVPKGLEGQTLKIIPFEGKNYLMFNLQLGKNQEQKEKERKQRKQELKKRLENRNILISKKKSLATNLKTAMKNNNSDEVKRITGLIGEIEAQIIGTKTR